LRNQIAIEHLRKLVLLPCWANQRWHYWAWRAGKVNWQPQNSYPWPDLS